MEWRRSYEPPCDPSRHCWVTLELTSTTSSSFFINLISSVLISSSFLWPTGPLDTSLELIAFSSSYLKKLCETFNETLKASRLIMHSVCTTFSPKKFIIGPEVKHSWLDHYTNKTRKFSYLPYTLRNRKTSTFFNFENNICTGLDWCFCIVLVSELVAGMWHSKLMKKAKMQQESGKSTKLAAFSIIPNNTNAIFWIYDMNI